MEKKVYFPGIEKIQFAGKESRNPMAFRYYDANLNLKKVYYETVNGMPDDTDMIEGVDYILLDGQGCLVDADGEVILNWAVFLDKYGDGENMTVETSFYNVNLAEEGQCHAIRYKNAVFLFDGTGNLLRVIDSPEIVSAYQSASFYEYFCYVYNDTYEDWSFVTYEGEALIMSNGMVPEYVENNWSNSGYIMCRTYNGRLFLEEYTEDGELISFSVELLDTMKDWDVSYCEAG